MQRSAEETGFKRSSIVGHSLAWSYFLFLFGFVFCFVSPQQQLFFKTVCSHVVIVDLYVHKSDFNQPCPATNTFHAARLKKIIITNCTRENV